MVASTFTATTTVAAADTSCVGHSTKHAMITSTNRAQNGGAAVRVVVGPRRAQGVVRRGDLGVAFGKKKKGFAELMGGEDDTAQVMTKKKGAASEAERCPCGGGDEGLPYSRCCKPYHKGEKYPQDCVTLMRSRFTGYAKGEGEYIVKTTHPENPIFKDGAKAESGKVTETVDDDDDDDDDHTAVAIPLPKKKKSIHNPFFLCCMITCIV